MHRSSLSRFLLLATLGLVAACGSDELTKRCPTGDPDCPCFANETCAVGLSCVAGVCRGEGHPGPASAKCYTPCKQGFTDEEGLYRACSEEGLMEGCIGGAECRAGSCLYADEEAPGCESDVECPDFQVCVAGTCHAECDLDSECGSGRVCERHTCRTTCAAATSTCPVDEFCQVLDGQAGVCSPLLIVAKSGEPASSVDGTVGLSTTSFDLSNSVPRATLAVTNDGPHPLDLQIVKVQHTEYTQKDSEVVTDAAMPWLQLGPEGDLSGESTVDVHVAPHEVLELVIDSSSADTPLRWDGVLEVRSETLGSQRISLNFAAEPTGRWAGKSYRFLQFGDKGLAAWRKSKSGTDLAKVSNAFVQKWAAFRNGDISFDEVQAVITATTSESWRWPSVSDACMALGAERPACYLYGQAGGVREYTDDVLSEPIPTSGVELPMAIDVKLTTDRTLSGRIVSDHALQYAADPSIELEFADDPKECGARPDGLCVAFLASLDAKASVGGRHAPVMPVEPELPSCDSGELVRAPWLVPGFLRGTRRDPMVNRPTRLECRDGAAPIAPGGDEADAEHAANLALAGANPVPDGASRTRTLSLVDGALIDQRTLILLVEEHFPSFLGASDDAGFSGYSLMVLTRDNRPLEEDNYKGRAHEQTKATVALADSVSCRPALVTQALGAGKFNPKTAADADRLASALIDGAVPSDEPAPQYAQQDVHYLCWETGLFDRGPSPASAPRSCPRESQVTFFANPALGDLSALPCQQTGSCQQVLDDWQASSSIALHLNPIWRCSDENQVYCDLDYTDLRLGKTFFQESTTAPAFLPLLTQVESAFRYKLRFQNRQGTNVGFAPAACVPNSNAVPYCYDAPTVEAISDRVDCLVELLLESPLSNGVRASVKTYLTKNFSAEEVVDPLLGTPVTRAGFERLDAELLNMLGDDAFTAAFKSRFDLAGVALAAFPGSLLEPNGIDLSGVAGYEMFVLYQATQYYQLVLDRFFALSPHLWKGATGPEATRFITPDTVVTYFDRVLLASAHKSRAFSEIGRRYQVIGRSDLARAVVERGYVAAYLESIVLSRMMRVVEQTNPQRVDQIRKVMDQAALTYRAALLDMREVHQSFSSDLNYFGFTSDYIPLPALEPSGPNALESLLAQAQQSTAVAAAKEDMAIHSDRSFESDAQAFQAELATIRTTHENQLAELCGTFEGDDGQVYPAIARYASKSEKTSVLGDPCGLMGKGEIHNAVGALQLAGLDVAGVRSGFETLDAQRVAEQTRIAQQCDLTSKEAQYWYSFQGEERSIQRDAALAEAALGNLNKAWDFAKKAADLTACIVGPATDCAGKATALATLTRKFALDNRETAAQRAVLFVKNEELVKLKQEAALFTGFAKCEALQIDGAASLTRIMLGTRELEIEALKKDIVLRLAGAEISRLRDRVTRILAEQEDTEQLSINAEAARNDPNARIYKNDAILNADRTFYDALRDAYKATKVFEYFTSQSYEPLAKLSLVRLVSRGDYNLEAYLAELGNAYQEFLEEHGRPDQRVDILSLRDDILAIPYLDEAGKARSQTQRIAEFRQILTSPNWLNGKGYLTIPFGTSLARLSPLTRNHKVAHVEAEIIGSVIGDAVGRLYLSQLGTGTVRPLDGSDIFFRFPARTAVLNPFFNGVRSLSPEVYRNFKLRDRPFANTSWELVLNQLDEKANQDIDLNSLTDVRLYLYYEDFTTTP